MAVEFDGTPKIDPSRWDVQDTLWTTARELVGDSGSASIGLRVVRFEWTIGRGWAIVRIRRGTRERARSAIACVNELDGEPVLVTVRGCSGTVAACEEKYLGRRQEESAERTVVYNGTEYSAVCQSEAVDIQTSDGVVAATTLDLQ